MIADPMADLTGGSAAQPDANHNGNSKEVLDPIAMQSNMMRIERIRSVMGIAAGCVAGIGGLTSWEGLICFLILHVFVCVAVWAWKMKFQLQLYTKLSWFGYLTTSIQPTALSFTLFWTLFYGLVYLY
ncbi:predicted protein [Phaeodactylum tricornutum CCAP 1055/1]|jgi:hypothetical protein|uniref:ER membrane protein complex subunit 6 n=2 Tax=Phaeodactylum tricornutum TaxID=2850 RepID=B7FYJ2_PHATC|nr:predicted protein [Phaeodactylum tricornutum CCAP 1055/1]EEC48737.1 predicted protein [Phaeodactylum tricornutum CCAP 1055/1]|eukprot:XP_002179751.1 predicted protein [Phaeodactylum tricornutum CCAP 1055/1]